MGIKELLWSILMMSVIDGWGQGAEDPYGFAPVPSRMAFGAVDGNNLLLTQTVQDETQWYCIDLSRGGIERLERALPKTSIGFATGPNGGTVIGSPANAKVVHQWRIAQGYFFRCIWPRDPGCPAISALKMASSRVESMLLMKGLRLLCPVRLPPAQ